MKPETMDKVLLLLYGMTCPPSVLVHIFESSNPNPRNPGKTRGKTEEKQEKP